MMHLLLRLARATIWQEREQVVRRLRCCGCRADDDTIILLQNFCPTGYIVDMSHRRHDAESSANEGCAQLTDNFFVRVLFRPERPRQIATQPAADKVRLMPISA
jgi:hypothetical protein